MNLNKSYGLIKNIRFAILLGFIPFIHACDPPDPPGKPDTKELSIRIKHVFNDTSTLFRLNGSYIDPVSGDTLVPTTLQYHINQFELKTESGKTIALTPKYLMFDLESGPDQILLRTMPETDEKISSISFTLGVEDSSVNASGYLNTIFTAPMYWGMINGYIHYKFEGNLLSNPPITVVLHAGGYLEPYKLSRRITMNLKQAIDLSASNQRVTLYSDFSKYLKGVNSIDLKTVNLIHQPNEDARKIADNWQGMYIDNSTEAY